MFMRHWVNQRLRYISNKNAVNQALQCTRKKPLIDWLIRNRCWLWRQANSHLDSNYGLRISRTNKWMNDWADERTNKDWVKIERVSAGWQQTTQIWTRVSSWYTLNWCQTNRTSQTIRIGKGTLLPPLRFNSSYPPDNPCTCPMKKYPYIKLFRYSLWDVTNLHNCYRQIYSKT